MGMIPGTVWGVWGLSLIYGRSVASQFWPTAGDIVLLSPPYELCNKWVSLGSFFRILTLFLRSAEFLQFDDLELTNFGYVLQMRLSGRRRINTFFYAGSTLMVE